MATVLMFHHVQGLTPGMRAFADTLRAAGHTVHSPDFFGGRVFDSIEEGFAFTQSGEVDIDKQADEEAAQLGEDLVYLGVSLGVMPAQRLAQTRKGARAAILLEAAAPITGEWAFGPWPGSVAVQIHGMDQDEFFAGDGDIDHAREIVAAAPVGELFVYHGDRHLFVDSSLPSFDADAAELLEKRVLEFLRRIDGQS